MTNTSMNAAFRGLDACDAEEIGMRLKDAIAIAEMMSRVGTNGVEFRDGTVSHIGGMLLGILDDAMGMLRSVEKKTLMAA